MVILKGGISMPWQSAPYIGQQVYNSNNEQGVITDLLNFELNSIPINDDFVSNWLNELSSTFRVIINWSNDEATCVPLNHVFPVTNSSPTLEPLIVDSNNEVLYNWTWQVPFLEEQRVTLNPNHPYYDIYLDQSHGTQGTIVNIADTINYINCWKPSPSNLDTYISVRWDCGHTNTYQVNALLPIAPIITVESLNKNFKIGQQVLLSSSHEYYNRLNRHTNNNMNAYVVAVNPRTVNILFEETLCNNPYSFSKTSLDIIDTEPIRQVTKYYIDNISRYLYNISGIVNPFLEEYIIKRGYTFSSVEILN